MKQPAAVSARTNKSFLILTKEPRRLVFGRQAEVTGQQTTPRRIQYRLLSHRGFIIFINHFEPARIGAWARLIPIMALGRQL